jgi:hypothetical protein
MVVPALLDVVVHVPAVAYSRLGWVVEVALAD